MQSQIADFESQVNAALIALNTYEHKEMHFDDELEQTKKVYTTCTCTCTDVVVTLYTMYIHACTCTCNLAQAIITIPLYSSSNNLL